MLNRRKVLFAAALMAAALPAMPVMASDSRLLADILAGVSDALTRDYIRRHLSGRPLGRQPLELRRPPLHARRVRPLLVEALRGAPQAEEAVRSREAAAASAAYAAYAASAAEARSSGRPESSEGAGPRQRQARRTQKRREARQRWRSPARCAAQSGTRRGRPPLTERRMMP